MERNNPRIQAGIRALEEEMKERYQEHRVRIESSEPSVLTPPENKIYRSYEVPIFWKKITRYLKWGAIIFVIYFLFFPTSLYFPLQGKLIAREMRVIDSKLDGEISAVFKSGGDFVRGGEVIGLISNSYLRGEKKRLQADIQIFQSEFDGMQKSFEIVKSHFGIYKRLYEEGDISRLQFQDEEMKIEEWRGRCKVKESEIRERKIRLENVEKKLVGEVIRSPISGVITTAIQEKLNAHIKEGEHIAEIAYGGMQFEFRVKEQAIRAIELGQRVTIKLDAFPGEKIEGIVDNIRPIVIEDNPKPWEKIYNARILVSGLTSLPKEARVGMSAHSKIRLKQKMSWFVLWFQNLF